MTAERAIANFLRLTAGLMPAEVQLAQVQRLWPDATRAEVDEAVIVFAERLSAETAELLEDTARLNAETARMEAQTALFRMPCQGSA